MVDNFVELRDSYEDFMRFESQLERVVTAIDDYVELNKDSCGIRKDINTGHVVGCGCPRVTINLSELRIRKPRLEQQIRHDPLRHLRALEAACHNIALTERPGYDKNNVKVKVAIEGWIGAAPSSPRNLTSSSLRHLVCIEGVAIKVSAIKPKIVKSVHYCPITRKHEFRDYVDSTDPQLGLPVVDNRGREIHDSVVNITSTVYPSKDKNNNPLETEYGLSIYKDHQTVVLQEMPERAPMGQLPRSVDLILDDDLVDKIKPGDRVQIVGVYRALSPAASGHKSTSGQFKAVVLVNNIQILGRDVSHLTFSHNDIRLIRSLGKRPDILSVLGRSLAPSIHGHTVIKKSLILQLLSGCEKNLANGTHLRGDINILMVGDPSTAKSQLLRSTMAVAPLAVSTTGKGSSGVGLTAAVTSDSDTREKRLVAGAMVLADRGLVCVDEFDKMNEADRVSIHEAMEQQTVTIAKAGIHASLNARCSVLAAANPVYGQYDRQRRIQENIGLPDSLLSRFDLLFIVLDQLDPVTDRHIASHVIRGHRYNSSCNQYRLDSDFDTDSDDEDSRLPKLKNINSIWQRSHNFISADEYIHLRTHFDDVLKHDFLRKYIHFAKARMKPVLTDTAREFIVSRYAEMRNRQDERTLPVTARSLETIIRLASAHAKARLSPLVEANPDCSTAMDILAFALYHENNCNDSGFSFSSVGMTDINILNTTPCTSGKRPRQNIQAKTSCAPSSSDLSSRLWEEIVRSETDEVMIKSLCSDIADRHLILNTLQSMDIEGRIMLQDDIVYQI